MSKYCEFKNCALKYSTIFLCLVGLFLACTTLIQIARAIFEFSIPFDTDEADHANAALEIYWQFTHGSFLNGLDALRRQSFYPPLNGMFVAFIYGLMEISLQSSRIFSFVCLLSSIAVFHYAIIRSFKISFFSLPSFFTLTLGALFFTTNPVFIENSSLCMLELCGVLICCLILLVTTFPLTCSSITLQCLLSAALFFTKYNFAIFILPALFVAYFFRQRSYAYIFALWCLLFIFSWLMVTNFESFKYFLFGHPSYAPLLSSSNVFFDLKSWVFDYHSVPAIGALTLLVTCTYIAKPKKTFSELFCMFGITWTLFVLFLSTTNESRHFIVAAPLVWFLALSFFLYPPTPARSFLKIVILAGAVVGAVFVQSDVRKVIAKGMEGQLSYQNLLEFATADIDPTLSTLVVGNHDRLSIETIQWYAARAHNLPYSQMKFDSYPFESYKVENAIKRARNGDEWFQNASIPLDKESLMQRRFYKQMIIFRRIGSQNDQAKLIKYFTDSSPSDAVHRKNFGSYEVMLIKL